MQSSTSHGRWITTELDSNLGPLVLEPNVYQLSYFVCSFHPTYFYLEICYQCCLRLLSTFGGDESSWEMKDVLDSRSVLAFGCAVEMEIGCSLILGSLIFRGGTCTRLNSASWKYNDVMKSHHLNS